MKAADLPFSYLFPSLQFDLQLLQLLLIERQVLLSRQRGTTLQIQLRRPQALQRLVLIRYLNIQSGILISGQCDQSEISNQ